MNTIRNPYLIFRSFATKPTLLQELSNVELQPTLSSAQFSQLCQRAKSEKEPTSALLLKLKRLFVYKLKWSQLTYSQFLSVLSTHMPLPIHQSILDRELITFFRTQVNQLNPTCLVQTRLFVAQYLSSNQTLSTALRSAVLRSLKILSNESLVNLLWEFKFHNDLSEMKYMSALLSAASAQLVLLQNIQLLIKLSSSLLEMNSKLPQDIAQELEQPLTQLAQLSVNSFEQLMSQMTLEEIYSLLVAFLKLQVQLPAEILVQLQEILVDSRRIVSINGFSTESIDQDIFKIYSLLLSTENPAHDLPKFRTLTLPQIYQKQLPPQSPTFSEYSSESLFQKLMKSELNFLQNKELVGYFPLTQVKQSEVRKVIHQKVASILKNEKELVLFNQLQKMREVGILSSSLYSQVKQIINQELFLSLPTLPIESIFSYLLTPDNCQLYFSYDLILSLRDCILTNYEELDASLKKRVIYLVGRCKDADLVDKIEDEREEWAEIKSLLQI